MNERTLILRIRRCFRPGFGKSVAPDTLEEVRSLRAQHPESSASLVLAGWSGASTARLFPHPEGAGAPIALVAGRHTHCDFGSIPGASLRHALILLWPPAGGQEPPFAEVIDLGTRSGITLPDGRRVARVAGFGPIRFGVGKADVVILDALPGEPFPSDPAALSDLLRRTPDRTEVTPFAGRPHTRYLEVPDAADLDRVTEGSEESCVAVEVEHSKDGTRGPEHVMLTQIVCLSPGVVNARVLVREKDLERGVRLGRYGRCRGSSVLGQDVHVSRVHAFVLDRAGQRWLFDTASTNGTRVVNVDTGEALGPVRGERTFALLERQAPSLAGQVALLEIGTPSEPC